MISQGWESTVSSCKGEGTGLCISMHERNQFR